MSMTRGARPDYPDVAERVESWRTDPRVTVTALGPSPEGRDIPCVTIADPGVPAEDKQRALIVAGQHGTEESGRAIALALADFLLAGSAEAEGLLSNQEIAIVPCCNPDGAQADTYENAQAIDTAHVFEFGRQPGSPEAEAIWGFARPFCPELFIDVHGLSGGSMSDRVWMDSQLAFSPNRTFMALMAQEATRASESLGYPTCELKIPPAIDTSQSHSRRIGERLALETGAMAFGVEAIEHYYTEKEWTEAGLARIRALLAYGSNDNFGLGERGYPNSLISGSRVCGLKAHGATASDRRASRVQLTAFLKNNMALVDRQADGPEGAALVRVFSETSHGERPDRFAVLLRFKKPFDLEDVTWKDAALKEGRRHGYELTEAESSVQMLVEIADRFGGDEARLEVRYRSPWLRGG